MTPADIAWCAAFAILLATVIVPAGAEIAGRVLSAAAMVLLRHAEALAAAYHVYVTMWRNPPLEKRWRN